MSAGSWEAALRAAGGAVAAVDALLRGEAAFAFAAGRPPGHHATRARAMGFCLFNNVALAALHALSAHGLERVLILDWDVHHGNGTNDLFHDTDAGPLRVDPRVAALSRARARPSDRGARRRRGLHAQPPGPRRVRATTSSWRWSRERVVPAARDYAPQLILVSAGYDAHAQDPLANCTMTAAGYGRMTAAMRRLADELGAPLGFVLEGGYALDALADSVAATLAALSADQGA